MPRCGAISGKPARTFFLVSACRTSIARWLEGSSGAFFLAARNVVRLARRELRALKPAPRWLREKAAKDRAFDALHGVDTGGVVELSDLRLESGNRRFGVDYIGVDPSEFELAISALDVAHEDFVFVDLGSGKGRALLMAAQYPFRSIVGVEFAPELHRAAEQNVARYAHPG